MFSGEFRTELARQATGTIDFYDVSMESARFADGEQDRPFVDYLHALFADRPVDLLVPLGGPAARFVQRNRQRLFPATPALIASTIEQPPSKPRVNATRSVSDHTFSDDLGAGMPNTRNNTREVWSGSTLESSSNWCTVTSKMRAVSSARST